MWTKVTNAWETTRSSYWFIPAVMSILAVVLSIFAIQFDDILDRVSPEILKGLFNNQPEGARSVLSTIAGSMITVAGVVFSISLVTLSSAASQYGPRLLTNFMRDQTNQMTLGTFIATFLYCLLILRSIQDAPPGTSGEDAKYFVPQAALLIGILLGICSIAVLIRFINKVPQFVHISLITSAIGSELLERLQERFPVKLGDRQNEDGRTADIDEVPMELRDPLSDDLPGVRARSNGYVRLIHNDGLMDLVCEHNIFLRLAKRPGDFVIKGEKLVHTMPDQDLSDEFEEQLRDCFAVGGSRTPVQDLSFLVQELVEIAARALSPGVNDPITAIACMNWLASAQFALAQQDDPADVRFDSEGTPRIYAKSMGFEELLDLGFGRLRGYVAGDANATKAALDLLDRVADHSNQHQRSAVMRERELLLQVANAMPSS